MRKTSNTRRWHSANTHPPRKGWYQTRRVGETEIEWRAWGNGCWWRQIRGGWVSWYHGDGAPHMFQWRGPAKSLKLDYDELPALTAA